MVSGLAERTQEYQENVLILAISEAADDVLCALLVAEEEKKDVKKDHFIGKRNVIYKRAKFNMRYQEPGKTAESSITEVPALAEVIMEF